MAPSRGGSGRGEESSVSAAGVVDRDATTERIVEAEGLSSSWIQTTMMLGWMWCAGFMEACCVHRITIFFIRSRVILRRTLHCFALNGAFLASILLLESVLVPCVRWMFGATSTVGGQFELSANLSGIEDAGRTHGIGSAVQTQAIFRTLYSLLWLYPAYVVSFIVNCLWYNDIAKHAFRALNEDKAQFTPVQGSTGRHAPAILLGRTLVDGFRFGLQSIARMTKLGLNSSWEAIHRSNVTRIHRMEEDKSNELTSDARNRDARTTQDPSAACLQPLRSPYDVQGEVTARPASSFGGRPRGASLAENPSRSQNAPPLSSDNAPLGPLLQGVGEQVFSLVMLSSFSGQVFAVSLIPHVGRWLSLILLSWLYAYYCFDYRWSFAGWSLEKRLHFFESHWPFFSGFGMPCVLATFFLPALVSAAVGAVIFPLFVLVATASDPTPIFTSSGRLSGGPSIGRLPIFRMASAQASFIIRLLTRGALPTHDRKKETRSSY